MNLIKKALVFFVCIAGIPSWAQNQPQQPSAFPGNGQVKLKWTANSDTVTIRYRVYADTSLSEQTQVDSTTADSIVVSGLTIGQIYYFRIAAVSDTGQSALSSADAAVPISLPGRTGKFNGSSSYAEVAYTSALNPSEFTVEMWVKSNNKDNTTHRKVLSSASMSFSLGYTGFEIQQTYYNGVIWSIWVYGSGGVYDVSGPPIDTSRWTHLAVTQSGGTWSLYVDGELANTQSPGYSVLNNARPLRIGASSTGSPSNYFDGLIDEVAMFNNVRSQSQIQADKENGLTGEESGLLALWHFDEGSGSSVFDASSNARNLSSSNLTYDTSRAMYPRKPGNLDAQSLLSGGVKLTWSQNPESDVQKYHIYADTANPPVTRVDSTLSASEVSKTLVGLTAGTKYYFVVSAVDQDNFESLPSVVDSATAPLPPYLTAPLRDTTLAEDFGNERYADLNDYFTDPGSLTFSSTALDPGIEPYFSGDTLFLSSDNDFNGSVRIRTTADNGTNALSDTFVVTVTPVNDPPVLQGTLRDTLHGEDWGKAFHAYLPDIFDDVDGGLSYTIDILSGNVTHVLSNDSLYFLSVLNFNGLAVVRVTATDGVASISDTLAITVMPINDSPTVTIFIPDTTIHILGRTFVRYLHDVFTDPDQDELNFGSGALDSGLTVDIRGDSLYITPTGAVTVVRVRIEANDGLLPAVADTFTVNVTPFKDINAGLPPIYDGFTAWGDYDNDGDLDVLIVGLNYLGNLGKIAAIYKNDDGAFANANVGFDATADATSGGFLDFDQDGYLDVFYTGSKGGDTRLTKLYRNNGDGSFSDMNTTVPGYAKGSVAFGDLDNDGDLDLIVMGERTTGPGGDFTSTDIYRNDGSGVFTDVIDNLVDLQLGQVTLADFDNDSDLDILIVGTTVSGDNGLGDGRTAKIYRNDGNLVFTDLGLNLLGVFRASCAWGDFNNDGKVDFVYTGATGNAGRLFKLYLGTGNSFVDETPSGLSGYSKSQVAAGDYDNDGDLDLLIFGETGGYGNYYTYIYENSSDSNFTVIQPGLTNAAAYTRGLKIGGWGDVDNDGDLDLLMNGLDAQDGDNDFTRIFRNDIPISNQAPGAPSNLMASALLDTITLSWSSASDGNQSGGLSYNLRIGTIPAGVDVVTPHAQISGSGQGGGYRRIPEMGNAGLHLSKTIFGLPEGYYYWSVQAIDHALQGSAFAAEPMPFFIDVPPGIPDSLTATAGYHSVHLRWSAWNVSDVSRYYILYDTVPNPVVNVDSTTGGRSDTSLTIDGLIPEQTYYFRIFAYDGTFRSDTSSDVTAIPLVPLPTVLANPASADFGIVFTSDSLDATIRISTQTNLIISGISLGAGIHFTATASVPDTLSIDDTLIVNVKFRPLSNGSVSDSLFISNNSATDPLVIPLSGEAITASIGSDQASLDFETMEEDTVERTVKVYTQTAVVISDAYLQSGSLFSALVQTPDTLFTGDTLTIRIAFHPASEGIFSDTLIIVNNSGGVLILPLSGIATPRMTAPIIVNALRDTTVTEDFGTIPVAFLGDVFGDPENDSLQFTVNINPSGMLQATINSDTLFLSDVLNAFGTTQIVVSAFDQTFTSWDTFYVTVTPVNDAPLLERALRDTTLLQNSGRSWVTSLAQHFTDPDEGLITFDQAALSSGVQPMISGDSLYVEVERGFTGAVLIRVTASDSEYTTADTFRVTVVDRSAPIVFAHVLSSPVVRRARIVIGADELLQTVSVLANGSAISVAKKGSVYFGEFDAHEGNLEIQVTASDLAGNVATVTRSYTIVRLAKPAWVDGFEFRGQADDYVIAGKPLTLSPVPEKWIPLSASLEISPQANGRSIRIDYRYDVVEVSHQVQDFDEGRIGVYQYADGQWTYAGGQGDRGVVTARVKADGILMIFYNPDHVVIPETFALQQNYPNPFNPVTTIRFDLPVSSQVKLIVYNILGQEVRILANDVFSAGRHYVIWDGRNHLGHTVSSGVYLYRIVWPTGNVTRRMLLIK